MRRASLLIMLFGLILTGLSASPRKAGADALILHRNWSWLKDTYWYVPQKYLPAVETTLSPLAHQLISDQTVWHIEDYSEGYFWGKQVVKLSTNDQYLCMQLVGSITPQGEIQMTFTFTLPPAIPPALNLKVSGLGKMRWVRGQWQPEMQMTTGVSSLVTHWAFMKQCRPGEACNQALPGVEIPLQDFLGVCPCASDPLCP
jgi:hypothetical protein